MAETKGSPYGGRRRSNDPWPHGQPTQICSACHGTGMDRAHASIYAATRTALDDHARADAVRCEACDGRGRITVAHALAIGQPVR